MQQKLLQSHFTGLVEPASTFVAVKSLQTDKRDSAELLLHEGQKIEKNHLVYEDGCYINYYRY